MLCMDRPIVAALPFLHAESGIDDVFDREAVGRARAVAVIVDSLVVNVREVFIYAVDPLLIIRLRYFYEMVFE